MQYHWLATGMTVRKTGPPLMENSARQINNQPKSIRCVLASYQSSHILEQVRKLQKVPKPRSFGVLSQLKSYRQQIKFSLLI